MHVVVFFEGLQGFADVLALHIPPSMTEPPNPRESGGFATAHGVSLEAGWTVITSEIGFIPKVHPELTEAQRQEVGEFLQALEENDDVHRVWAAVK